MKLKIGDKVRIRKDLEVFKKYGDVIVVPSMEEWFGETVTVSFIDSDGDFKIKEDDQCWAWALEMVENKANINKLIFSDNTTILLKDGKRYVTKCQADDTYDREKGLLLCLAKANGYTYNDICEMLNNAEYLGKKPDAVKFDGVREVKRPAKVGEYVKVVNATSHNINDYANGDILKIIKKEKGILEIRYYYKNAICKYITEPEYVVLENYTPYKITLSEFWANKGKKDMAIHCKTDDEADELLKAFDRVGQVWNSGDKYTKFAMFYGSGDLCYTNNNRFCYYVPGEIDGIMVYKFNEVDLSK